MASARRVGTWLCAAALLGAAGSATAGEPQEPIVASILLGRRPGDGRMVLAARGEWLRPGALWKYQAVYWRGREVLFDYRDATSFVSIDGGEPQLASILVETPAQVAEVKRLIAAGARGFAVVVIGNGDKFPDLPVLPAGRELALVTYYSSRLDVGKVAAQTGIESLKITDMDDFDTDLSPLAGMTRLRHLNLYRCRRFKWASLAKLVQLEAIEAGDCGDNCNLAVLKTLPRLVSLRIVADTGLPRNFAALADMTQLRRLGLSGCRDVADLSFLASLARLEALELSCGATDIAPVARLKGLRWLSLAYCRQLSDLSPLAKLKQLASLSLAGCDRVTNLATVARVVGLRELDLSYCAGFSELSPLAGLTQLRRLDLRRCTGVRDLRPLKSMVRAGAEVLVDDPLKKQLDALGKTDF